MPKFEPETVGPFGNGRWLLCVLTSQLRGSSHLSRIIRFEVGAIANYCSISGVVEFDDRNEVQFGGLALEGRLPNMMSADGGGHASGRSTALVIKRDRSGAARSIIVTSAGLLLLLAMSCSPI
jgi:hypothetical protein